jgi:acyl carrier protein
MITVLERFLFSNFNKMPAAVRVVTYLLVLSLFSYLLLVPRFINGKLVVESKTGGYKPYRAGILQMHIEGRVLKFKVNEEGYWSVPNVSLLPHTVRIEVLHVDADEWFPVYLKWNQLWTRDVFHVAISTDPPGIKLLAAGARGGLPSRMVAALAGPIGLAPSLASAAELQLPANLPPPARDVRTLQRIEADVFHTISDVTGIDPREIKASYPLTGKRAPSYSQRIEIIDRLERRFGLRIPDEHWTYLNTAGELVDYVQKRLAYRLYGRSPQQRDLQNKEPIGRPAPQLRGIEERPVFKR